jgi:flagellar L-ring protein precursor FlgH
MKFIIGLWLAFVCMAKPPRRSSPPVSDLDEIISEAFQHSQAPVSTPGSLYSGSGPFNDLARDLRSFQIDDLVMIVVSDQATAVAKGATTGSRKSDASASIGGLFGTPPAAARLGNLLQTTSDRSLQGQGETSRETTISTTVSARVTHLLPNGYLVVEGIKNIGVNSEHQRVIVRGIVRPYDISAGNQIPSNRLANLEVRIDGKGVVQDSIHRPNFLYRLLMGVLPF